MIILLHGLLLVFHVLIKSMRWGGGVGWRQTVPGEDASSARDYAK